MESPMNSIQSYQGKTKYPTNGLQHYDITNVLDNIKSVITMRQLLDIAPHCKSRLNSSVIQKKPKTIKIHDTT